MKKILIAIGLFLSVAYGQNFQIRPDTIEHTNSDGTTKLYHGSQAYQLETDLDSFNFNKPVLVNGVEVGSAGGSLDSLVFNQTVQAATDGKLYRDRITKLFAYYIKGQANPNYINVPNLVPIVNETSDTLFSGTPISVRDTLALYGTLPLVSGEGTCANNRKSSELYIGVADGDIPPDSVGIISRFDFITGDRINTILQEFSVGDRLWCSADTSELTNIAPMPPNYRVFVGTVFEIGGVRVLGVNSQNFTESDTDVNLQGVLNGLKTKKPRIHDTIISNVLYSEISNDEDTLADLPFMFAGERELLNTTDNVGRYGRARVALQYGTNSTPLKNYVYIDNSGAEPALAVSTVGYPDGSPRVIAYGVYSQAKHEEYGFAYVRRVNDAIDGTDANGLFNKILKWIRQQGSSIVSGVDPTVEIVASAGLDTLKVSTSLGVGIQLNSQIVEALESPYHWWYSPNGGDSIVANLSDIGVASDGTSIRTNNARARYNFFLVINSGDYASYIAVAVSNGTFASDEGCINNSGNLSITTPPTWATDVSVRLFSLPVRYTTAAGGTLINLIDLTEGTTGGFQAEKNFPFGYGGTGGSSSGGATYPVSDAVISISANAAPTSILDFDASGVTPGTEATLIMADRDVDLTAPTFDSLFIADTDIKINKTGFFGRLFGRANRADTADALLIDAVLYDSIIDIEEVPWIGEYNPDSVAASDYVWVKRFTTDGLYWDSTLVVPDTASGSVSLGSDGQIPYMNLAGTDFEYYAGLTWVDPSLKIGSTGYSNTIRSNLMYMIDSSGSQQYTRVIPSGFDYYYGGASHMRLYPAQSSTTTAYTFNTVATLTTGDVATFQNNDTEIFAVKSSTVEAEGVDVLRGNYFEGALTDGAPDLSEIETIVGLTAAQAGSGRMVTIKDTNGTGLYYDILSDGTDWIYFPGRTGTAATTTP